MSSVLSPVLLAVVLLGWGFASPIGASPDEDYHLNTINCIAESRTTACEPGSSAANRLLPEPLHERPCFAFDPTESAACFVNALETAELTESRRGNFQGAYPPLFHATLSIFVGEDLERSVALMRGFNAVLAVVLVGAVAMGSPRTTRPVVILGALLTSIPLGLFLIPSVNASSWAIVGVFVSWLALHGALTGKPGWRQRMLFALTVVGAVMAAGARADAAVFAVVGILLVCILNFDALRKSVLAVSATVVALVSSAAFALSSSQIFSALLGFSVGAPATEDGGGASELASAEQVAGAAVADATSVVNTPDHPLVLFTEVLTAVPSLWAGSLGLWGLGWLDTPIPAAVPILGLVAVGIGLGLGFTRMRGRLLVVFLLAVAALTIAPTWTQFQTGTPVGSYVQPRYILPLLMLVVGIGLIGAVRRHSFAITLGQLIAMLSISAVTMPIALYANLRRNVTGVDGRWLNLSHAAEWWWSDALVGPMVLWGLISLAWFGLMAALGVLIWDSARPQRVRAVEFVEQAEAADSSGRQTDRD